LTRLKFGTRGRREKQNILFRSTPNRRRNLSFMITSWKIEIIIFFSFSFCRLMKISLTARRQTSDRQNFFFFSSLFFYSRCLLTNENEFQACIQHFFPDLNLNQPLEFTRKQWNLIRKRFGKPRRYWNRFLLFCFSYWFWLDYQQII